MFAYCRSNPVRRVDISGSMDQDCYDNDPYSEEDLLKTSEGGGGTAGASSGAPSLPTHSSGCSPTKIYRYGYTDDSKLVPTIQDVNSNTGLSFSTKYRPGAAETTIEEVNSTQVLRAVQDGKYHVSVYPIGASIADWHAAGSNSIWTRALVSIVSAS